ncbi:MAG: hypothetical protein U5Q03_02565 [Bacteroidota bacterium]|nr:hypothetical protein [Bacteroidota bacterium]
MNTKDQQFIIDNKGNKVAIILPMDDYQKLLDELEEVEDVKLYDQAKNEDDGSRISLSDYLQTRKETNA